MMRPTPVEKIMVNPSIAGFGWSEQTASPKRLGSFDTHRLRGSCASISLAPGRWRNANLHGRRGSAGT